MSSALLSFFLLATACANPLGNIAREECKPCNPQGASGTKPPTVGPELRSLYVDVLESVKDIHFRKRWADPIVSRADTFCCRETLDCVNVQNLNVPMCYDKFTTQFAFPDGSWGSLTTGLYNSPDSGSANLKNGTYFKAGGEIGNIYSADPGAKPNTATLSIPPQWTGTGVGSAIPPTEIASYVTNAPTPTASATTPTDGSPGVAQSTGAPFSSRSTGGQPSMDPNSNKSLGMSIFMSLMYALYAL